jgi:hypothetical protein
MARLLSDLRRGSSPPPSDSLGSATPSARPFVATGWLLWLTWAYVALFGVGLALQGAILVGWNPLGALFGIEVSDLGQISVVWVLIQLPYILFAIGCVGILLHDRDFAWVAVLSAWVIAAVQFVQAFLQLFHLRLSVPISAFIFIAYAVRATKVLRPSARQITTLPGRGAV